MVNIGGFRRTSYTLRLTETEGSTALFTLPAGVAALHEERQRERQERGLKEGHEAITREVAERNRRAGWA